MPSPLVAQNKRKYRRQAFYKDPRTAPFSHTRTEDPIPGVPAHQGTEFLQHLFFHKYKHRGNLICVPAREHQ